MQYIEDKKRYLILKEKGYCGRTRGEEILRTTEKVLFTAGEAVLKSAKDQAEKRY